MSDLAPDGYPWVAPISDPRLLSQARTLADKLYGTTTDCEVLAEELAIDFTTALGQHLDHVAWLCRDCNYWCKPEELKDELCHGCR